MGRMVAAPASPLVVFDRVGVLRDDSVLLLEAALLLAVLPLGPFAVLGLAAALATLLGLLTARRLRAMES